MNTVTVCLCVKLPNMNLSALHLTGHVGLLKTSPVVTQQVAGEAL